MSEHPSVLSVKDVRYSWPGRATFDLSVPDFSIATGEKVLLLGESGSGKSTLLSLICGTLAPKQGAISVSGVDLTELSASQRDRFRAENIGVIFQQFNLLPFGSVIDNILLPLRFAPKRRARVEDLKAAAAELCEALGLPREILSASANTLSVGQQQRVAVARSMIGQPPLIIADEPTSALDEESRDAFLGLMFDQIASNGSTLLMVSHDPRLADHFDRVERLKEIASTKRGAA